MEIEDRGMIKWQPFNSCFSTSEMIKDINKNKNRLKYPILSEDQLIIIQDKILESFELKNNIELKYFYNGNIYNINGIINNIDIQNKKIYLNNISIYFKQILEIN